MTVAFSKRTGKLRWAGYLLLATLPLFLGTSLALAQSKGGGVIRLEETVIEGRVQKPNAFFVSTRQALVYEMMELLESFIEKIHEVIERGEI